MNKDFEALKKEWTPLLKEVVSDPDFKKGSSEALTAILGLAFFKRKLRKLGFSKKEIYVISALFSALTYIRMDVSNIRKEVTKSDVNLDANFTKKLEDSLNGLYSNPN